LNKNIKQTKTRRSRFYEEKTPTQVTCLYIVFVESPTQVTCL